MDGSARTKPMPCEVHGTETETRILCTTGDVSVTDGVGLVLRRRRRLAVCRRLTGRVLTGLDYVVCIAVRGSKSQFTHSAVIFY